MKNIIFSALLLFFARTFGYSQTNEIQIVDDTTLIDTKEFITVSDAFEPRLWQLFSNQELSELSFNGISYLSFRLSNSGKVVRTTFGKHFPLQIKEKIQHLFNEWSAGFWEEQIKEKLLPVNKPICLVIQFTLSSNYAFNGYIGFSDLNKRSNKYFFLEPISLNKFHRREVITFSESKR